MNNGWEEFEIAECDECGSMLSIAELRRNPQSYLYVCAECAVERETLKKSRKKVLDLPPYREERSI